MYLVKWAIDLDAPNATAAAQQALTIQRDPTSIALCFTVINRRTGKRFEIDLLQDAAAR